MNSFTTGSTSKGQIKCFHCRCSTRTRDGAWHEVASQQVFLCKICKFSPALKTSPVVSVPRLI